MNHNIAQTLYRTTAFNPEGKAVVVSRGGHYQQYTFEQVLHRTAAYAAALADQRIEPADRVILMVRPSLDFICLTFALFQLGVPVILIDPGMGYKNLLRCIASVRPTVFIGIPKAQIFRKIFSAPFQTVRKSICVGRSLGILGKSLDSVTDYSIREFPVVSAAEDDLAAVIFTTGSTGPPKGVRYDHGVFQAQLEIIRDYYGIRPHDIDLPAFPLFALFTIAMGATAVIPDMDPAHPSRVNPGRFARTINDNKVTYSFGSPAIWNVVSRYCLRHDITLPNLTKVLMAGAPVPGELIERVKRIMPEHGEIHTPYGATESLPATSITGSEILSETWEMTRQGKGTCVGRPLPGNDVRVIEASEKPFAKWDQVTECETGNVGEIVIQGPVVTRGYDNNPEENRMSKIADRHGFWHRIGDVGYFDDQGRLWFCGRKAHRVITRRKILYTIPCEAIFNEHPAVYRSALVGVDMGAQDDMLPVLVVEPNREISDVFGFIAELKKLGKQHAHTANINIFLLHPDFPVDIRHNAKIFREKLAVWARDRLYG